MRLQNSVPSSTVATTVYYASNDPQNHKTSFLPVYCLQGLGEQKRTKLIPARILVLAYDDVQEFPVEILVALFLCISAVRRNLIACVLWKL